MVIAIDVSVCAKDKKKCGICFYDEKINTIYSISSMSLASFFIMLLENVFKKDDITVLFEDSNMKKGNWHGQFGREAVGKNKAACTILRQFLEKNGIKNKPIAPAGYSKLAKNSSGFFSQYEMPKKTTEDIRASMAMIILNHENVKVDIKNKRMY